VVSDTILNDSQANCFNAVETITVAGEPSNVFIQNGASVDFIAGRSIVFLPGFYAEAGSHVHAYITTDATFCIDNGGGILQNPIAEKSVTINKSVLELSSSNDLQKMIKVFPNPNNGTFVLEIKNFDETAKVYIYSILGSVVYENVVREQSLLEIDIQHLNKGLYFVKVIDGNQSLTNKMIVN
ncbi:MAG TPA: T9SS type A sorting domain-containing protein, partial [Prolixibacteraceae bacterium]|nr:T9SS type A sorting domain-containing protein [Prolixibacteraceae bacterium]